MKRVDAQFKDKVFEFVSQIPRGRLMTYRQLAALAGAPWAAWEVGQIAHRGPTDLPWQRVVNKNGGLARGYPGGMEGHKRDLALEGVVANEDYQVNIGELQWHPVPPNQSSLL